MRRHNAAARWFAVWLGAVGIAAQAQAGDLGTDAYVLPILGPYAIVRSWPFDQLRCGRYQLATVEVTRHRVGGHPICTHVEKYAVAEKVIVGKTTNGYFIFDTNLPEVEPRTFSSQQEWLAAMSQMGIAHDIELLNPDEEAARVPDKTLHPWDYRMMHGLLGQPDAVFAVGLEVAAFLGALLLGVFPRARRHITTWAVALAISVVLVSRLLILGGGPGAAAGLILYPIIFVFAAHLGLGARSIVIRMRGEGHAP